MLGSPVEELAAARAQPRQHVLEIGRSGGGRPENGRVKRAAPAGKKPEAEQAACDLEAPVGDVLVRDAIGKKMQRRAEQDRRGA